MVYDDDLRGMRRTNWALQVINLVGAVCCAWAHDWIATVVSLIWSYNLYFWRGMMRAQQRTRDQARLTDSMMLRLLMPTERDRD